MLIKKAHCRNGMEDRGKEMNPIKKFKAINNRHVGVNVNTYIILGNLYFFYH